MKNDTCGTCEHRMRSLQKLVLEHCLNKDSPKHYELLTIHDTCDHHTPKEDDVDARIEYSEQLSDGIPQPTAGHEPGKKECPHIFNIDGDKVINPLDLNDLNLKIKVAIDQFEEELPTYTIMGFDKDGVMYYLAEFPASAPRLAAENENLRKQWETLIKYCNGIKSIELRGALDWLLQLAYHGSKSEGTPLPGEFEAACKHLEGEFKASGHNIEICNDVKSALNTLKAMIPKQAATALKGSDTISKDSSQETKD